jgi:hypothetical protein
MVANDEYLQYLAEHVNEDEVLVAITSMTMNTDDLVDQSLCFFCRPLVCKHKRAKGLWASGLGSVSCSRHDMF